MPAGYPGGGLPHITRKGAAKITFFTTGPRSPRQSRIGSVGVTV